MRMYCSQDENGRRLKEAYQQKIQVIAENLKAISELEEVGSDDMDALSGHFGNIMAEICARNMMSGNHISAP